jgi:glycosyltransferase involved in cell wall biosynthesis
VHQYPPDYRGGTEYYTQTLAAAQAQQGHAVAVFVPAPTGDQGRAIRVDENGVVVYRVPVGSRSRTKVFLHSLRQPGLRQAWREVLAQFEPDLVHVQHLMGLPFGLIEDIRVAGLPFVVTLHDYWFICANAQLITNTDGRICAGPDEQAANCARCALARGGAGSLGWLAPALAPVMRYRNESAGRFLNTAARVIAPTAFVRDVYAQAGLAVDRLRVVPHGIDLPVERIAAARELWRMREGDGRLHIGYIGSIGYLKGLHVLIDAVNALPPESVTLTIYGGLSDFPDYVRDLQQRASHPGITFAGVVARDDLWPAMADFDVVVLPTLWYEVSPLVIDEVFAMGIPIVASNIGAMAEKIRDGENGRLFPPGDVAALTAILDDLQHHPGQLAEWADGMPAVQSVAAHMKAIEEVYAAALVSV